MNPATRSFNLFLPKGVLALITHSFAIKYKEFGLQRVFWVGKIRVKWCGKGTVCCTYSGYVVQKYYTDCTTSVLSGTETYLFLTAQRQFGAQGALFAYRLSMIWYQLGRIWTLL
jgi:hypothetical protein